MASVESSPNNTDLDPDGVLLRLATGAAPLTEAQRGRIVALMRPGREDQFTAKLGTILRAQR